MDALFIVLNYFYQFNSRRVVSRKLWPTSTFELAYISFAEIHVIKIQHNIFVCSDCEAFSLAFSF